MELQAAVPLKSIANMASFTTKLDIQTLFGVANECLGVIWEELSWLVIVEGYGPRKGRNYEGYTEVDK